MARHVLRGIVPVVIGLAIAGCGDKGIGDPAGPGAGPVPCGYVHDAGPRPDAATAPDAGPPTRCAEPLVGTTAFSRTLHAAGTFAAWPDHGNTTPAWTRDDTFDVAVYFPRGRVPGAPVVLAHPTLWPHAGLIVVSGVLGADGGLDGLSYRGNDGRELHFDASLAGPDGPLALTIERNFAFNSDVPAQARATLIACPSDATPVPALTAESQLMAPTATLWLQPSVPLDLSTLRLTAHDASGAIAIALDADAGSIGVRPTGAWAPNARVTIVAESATDVLGNVITYQHEFTPLATTAAVSDRGFGSAPPEGAIAVAGASATVADGVLHLGTQSGLAPWSALIALGEPASAVRARLHLEARGPLPAMALVTADGHRSDFAPDSASASGMAATVPGPGPLWLSIVQSASNDPARTQGVPIGTDTIDLDEVAFE